jgi:integrase
MIFATPLQLCIYDQVLRFNGYQDNWGHASVKMTADVYYHYLPDPHGSSHSNALPEINLHPGANVLTLKKR